MHVVDAVIIIAALVVCVGLEPGEEPRPVLGHLLGISPTGALGGVSTGVLRLW